MMGSVGVALAAAVTGVISGLAIGGGSLLVPALVFLFGVGQHKAQGVVLLAFLPVALVAAVVHYRQGFVRTGPLWRLAIAAGLGAAAGASLAALLPADMLRRVFGLYLLLMAGYTFFTPGPSDSSSKGSKDK